MYTTNNINLINVSATSADSNYEMYKQKNYSLSKGENTIIYGKDKKSNKDLSIKFYVINNQLSTITNNDINNLFESSVKHRYIFLNLLADIFKGQEPVIGEEYKKCPIEGCKTINNLISYINNNYNTTNKYAEEIVNSLKNTNDIKIMNNEIYFRNVIAGWDEGIKVKLQGTYIENNNLFLLINDTEYESHEILRSYLVKATNKSGKYLIDDCKYIGKLLNK